MKKKLLSAVLAAAMMLPAACPSMAAESAMNTICAPSGIVEAGDGSFLVTDTYNKVIWKVNGGISTVFAGKTGAVDIYGEPLGGYNDSSLDQSYFKQPWAITPFLDGFAVTDTESNVVRLVRAGNNKTQTATGKKQKGAANGYGIAATFSHPTGLANDEEGNLYIADTGNNKIRKLTPTGDITTYMDSLNEPTGLCWKNGVLYVAESGANRTIKIVNGSVYVAAGSGTQGTADGSLEQAQFSEPQGVAVSDDGTVYVSDTGNSSIRKIQNGQVTTLIACDKTAMEQYPMEPIGLMICGNQLYVCDNFSKKVFVIARQ